MADLLVIGYPSEAAAEQVICRRARALVRRHVHPALGARSHAVVHREVLGRLHRVQLLDAEGIAGTNDGRAVVWIRELVEQERDAAQSPGDHLLEPAGGRSTTMSCSPARRGWRMWTKSVLAGWTATPCSRQSTLYPRSSCRRLALKAAAGAEQRT